MWNRPSPIITDATQSPGTRCEPQIGPRSEATTDHRRCQDGDRRTGLAATSLRDIAAAAQVSVGTVTYHFVGVDEILSAVVITESESFYAKVVQAADSEPDPRRAMLILIDSLFSDSDKTSNTGRSGPTTGQPPRVGRRSPTPTPTESGTGRTAWNG